MLRESQFSMQLRAGRGRYPRASTLEGCPIVVCKSPIHGQGCFSTAEISIWTIIIEYIGERINLYEAVCRDHRCSPAFSPYILTLDDDMFIDGANGGNESRFINHSCNPNCTVLRKKDRAFIVASGAISMGVELSIDYDYEDNRYEPCCCGIMNCRGFI